MVKILCKAYNKTKVTRILGWIPDARQIKENSFKYFFLLSATETYKHTVQLLKLRLTRASKISRIQT